MPLYLLFVELHLRRILREKSFRNLWTKARAAISAELKAEARAAGRSDLAKDFFSPC
jgi:hypothetical protein